MIPDPHIETPRVHKPPLPRSIAVDVVRGVAIFLVAVGHTNQGELLRGWWAGATPFATWMNKFIYAFHMPAFFFVAGVFLLPSLARRGEKRFTIEKARTLIYPYVVWLTLGALSPLLLHNYERLPMPSMKLYFGWLFTGSFQWFLPTLFFMMIVAMLGRRLPMWLLFALSCAVSMTLAMPRTHASDMRLTFVYLGLRNLPFLILGMWVGFGFAKVERLPRWMAAVACAVCGALLGWAATKPLTTTAPGFLVAGVLGTLMLFLLARTLHTGWPARALAWVGEGSLGVFLLSGYFQGGTRAVVFHVVHTNPWAQLLLTSLGATLFPAWIYNNRLKWRIDWLFVAPWGGRQPVRRTAPQVDLSTR